MGQPVGVRDIYALEFKIFSNPLWVAFYVICVCIFMTHACLGWKKATPVLGIPKVHQDRVVTLGYIIICVIGLIYLSFPLYCTVVQPFPGKELDIQQIGHSER